LTEKNSCGNSGTNECHGNYFHYNVSDALGVIFHSCEATLGKKDRLVIISGSCNSASDGLCINMAQKGAYLAGKRFDYVNNLDILALLIGWEYKDAFGNVAGEDLYNYMDAKFMELAQLASTLQQERIDVILETESSQTCINAFREMKNKLAEASSTTSKSTLVAKLEESKHIHKNLVMNGCDYE
ncbi:MAG: hypothetical protein KKC05_03475, partial [Nanoarchaeota archaeon]|nr:hypothetical protein [Nanoarchaeota archaeon]